MSLTVALKFAGGSGNVEENNVVSGDVVYLVTGATASDTEQDILDASGLPSIGSSLRGGVVTRLTARPTESVSVWEVSAEYGNPQHSMTSQSAPGANAADPVLRPTMVRWSTQRYPEVLVKDAANNPIVNSVGDPFDPPLLRDRIRPVVTVSMFLDEWDHTQPQHYVEHVNSVPWKGYLARQVKCVDINAETRFENNYFCWYVTWVFEIAAKHVQDNWDVEVLDRGPRHRKLMAPNFGAIVRFRDGNDVLEDGVGLLNASGYAINEAQGDDVAGRFVENGEAPHYLKFRIYEEADFNLLPIYAHLNPVNGDPD